MSQILNLEQAPKIGILKAVKEGCIALIKNRFAFFKMQAPIAILLFLVFANYIALFFKFHDLDIMLNLIYTFACVYFAIGISAISYLAKDIYENKPIQKPSVYFDYVKFHFLSLSKLYIFKIILYLVLSFLYISIMNIQDGKDVYDLMYNFAILYFSFTSITDIFWAYQDKIHPINSFIDVIKTFFKSPKFICFCAAFVFLLAMSHFILIEQMFSRLLDCEIYKTYKLITGAAFCVLVYAYYSILTYIISFIFTRVYFEIKK